MEFLSSYYLAIPYYICIASFFGNFIGKIIKKQDFGVLNIRILRPKNPKMVIQ